MISGICWRSKILEELIKILKNKTFLFLLGVSVFCLLLIGLLLGNNRKEVLKKQELIREIEEKGKKLEELKEEEKGI